MCFGLIGMVKINDLLSIGWCYFGLSYRAGLGVFWNWWFWWRECELSSVARRTDPVHGGLVVPMLGVVVAADEASSEVHAGHACGSASHREVQDGLSFFGVGLDEVFHQRHWFLGWVQHIFVCVRKVKHLPRISSVFNHSIQFMVLSGRRHSPV